MQDYLITTGYVYADGEILNGEFICAFCFLRSSRRSVHFFSFFDPIHFSSKLSLRFNEMLRLLYPNVLNNTDILGVCMLYRVFMLDMIYFTVPT